MTSAVIYFFVIIVGIFVGIGIALRIIFRYVRDTLLIGDFTNSLEDYAKEPIQILSESSRKM